MSYEKKASERPVAVFEDGQVEASVWRRRDAKGNETYHVSLVRSYLGQDGAFQKCSTYSMADLQKILKLAADAERWVLGQRRDGARDRAHDAERKARGRRDGGRDAADAPARSQPQSQSDGEAKLDRLVDRILKRLDDRNKKGPDGHSH
jgi:hypothetical protein